MIGGPESPEQEIERLQKRLGREKSARLQAEMLLEQKSRELYEINSGLGQKAGNLEKRLGLFESAVVNANDAVIITTANLSNPGPEIVYVNEAFSKLSGYLPEEVIGKNPRMLQGADTDKRVLKKLKDSLAEGKPFKGELKNYSKNRVAYWLEISIVPVKDENGNITHFAAIERDISQRKAFEKELIITREAAEVASRAKSDFLANMSHELRTPMNAIIGLTDLLNEMKLTAEQQELSEAVNSSSRNLLILLNDILDLSKIEAGELTLESISFDLRRTVNQTIDLLSPMTSRKGLPLDCTISPTVPDRIIGDPARLQQIMNNLIGNAIKFTDTGCIRLDLTNGISKAGAPTLLIRVEDTGIGIPEDKQEAVFNKFTQADVTTARKYGGTGLGLTITRDLIEMMKGTIRLESVEGRGSTFYVEIPIQIETNAKEDSTMTAEARRSNTSFNLSAHLMVVDDHPINLLFMRKVLKKLGFENVDECASGQQALDMLSRKKYDLIFMDCQMPEMDGFEASSKIREIEEFSTHTKIIAVTADAMKGARERCIDAGMDDYISKPVDIEKLKAILVEWLPDIAPVRVPDIIEFQDARPKATHPVMDWERLHMFTDGNPDEEKILIEMFKTYAEESLAILQENCKGDANEEWKKAAHKLKGSAANLGAVSLSESCMVAETAYTEDLKTKEEILCLILDCYRQVLQELES
ncbi:MAG: response regulator [Alphaproteobacteria bacterium]